jgi:hypothetical protein
MKINLRGVMTIEITDPKGLCNEKSGLLEQIQGQIPNITPWQPTQPVIPPPQPVNPYPAGTPFPSTPSPWHNTPMKHPAIYTTPIGQTSSPKLDPDWAGKWGHGIPESQTAEPRLWIDGWKSKMSPEQLEEAYKHGYTAISQ